MLAFLIRKCSYVLDMCYGVRACKKANERHDVQRAQTSILPFRLMDDR